MINSDLDLAENIFAVLGGGDQEPSGEILIFHILETSRSGGKRQVVGCVLYYAVIFLSIYQRERS